uniref:hypothetical protein n=1 Tax=Caldivirga sp. UBA161 TaxID=1915569 RepID=UPI0025BEA406
MAVQDIKPSGLSRMIAALGGLLTSLIALAPLASFTVLTITNHGFMLLMLVVLGGLIAISAVGRLNQASILGLLAYLMALALASWSWFYKDPIGSMLRLMPLLIIPTIIIGVQIKLFNSSSSQGVSPLFSIGSLLLMFQPRPGPLIGAAWALAGGVASAYEAFSMPTLPALTYIITYLIGSMMQGTLPWEPISLTPLGFYSVFVNNIAKYSNPTVLSLAIVMAVVYVASPSIARLIKGPVSPILASLLASAASAIPMLAYGQPPALLIAQNMVLLLIAALPASYIGVWYVNSTDVLPMLYGSIADIPDRYNLIKYYHEDWEALIGLDSAKRELIIAAESFRGNGVR